MYIARLHSEINYVASYRYCWHFQPIGYVIHIATYNYLPMVSCMGLNGLTNVSPKNHLNLILDRLGWPVNTDVL